MLTLALLAALAPAGELLDWRQDWSAVRESLSNVEPWFRTRWLARRGLQDYYRASSWEPRPDSGLTCIGRWSYGPSVRVSLRTTADDTIVCLARGSGASIIRFRSHDSLGLELLSDINCHGLVSRAIIRDTLVFCGMNQGGTGIEIWGVGDLSQPHLLSYVYLPPVHDIAVKDSYLFTTSIYSGDSLHVFNVADPSNPVRVGACKDSGDMMCVSGNNCYLGGQYGLFILDVSNPATPHRVGSIGSDVISVAVRDTLCFFGTTEFALRVYNVRNPAAPVSVGSLSGIEASDIFLPSTCDTVLYTPKLHVINIANPRSPRQVGFVNCPGWDYGVTAVPSLNNALVADYFDGLVVVDIGNPMSPIVDTSRFGADLALDIYIDQNRAYLAQEHAGLGILDVSNASRPFLLGQLDTAGQQPGRCYAVAAKDSLACICWSGVPFFRTVDVGNPARPSFLGGYDVPGYPEDMVLRDSLVYVAQLARFQIVNVAQPRSPVLVGSCSGDGVAVEVRDTFAYTGAGAIRVTNVARPDSPFVVTTISRASPDLSIVDSLLFCNPGPAIWYSLANPAVPVPIDSIDMGHWITGMAAVNRTIYACSGPSYTTLYAISIADLHQPRVVAQTELPYCASRIVYAAPYLYVVCWDAGVCIYDTTQTAIAEPKKAPVKAAGVEVRPSVARGRVMVRADGRRSSGWSVWDAAGRVVMQGPAEPGEASWPVDLSSFPPGAYWLEVRSDKGLSRTKLVRP